MENSEQMPKKSNQDEKIPEKIPENSEIKGEKRKSLLKLQRLSLNLRNKKLLLQRLKRGADPRAVLTQSPG